jgi:ABC-2 type transport system permease protein
MKALLKVRLLALKNRFSRMGYGDVGKLLFFGGIGALFLAALYWGFLRLLWEVHSVEIVGGLLVTKLMSMVFLTTFCMIAFSGCIASFSTLFFARDLSLLIHSPLPFRTVFLFKALETAFLSSWMVAAVMLPFFAAYGAVYEQGPGFYGTLSALAVPFVGTAALLGVGVSLGLMCVFPSRRVREAMLLLGAIVGCGVYILFRWLSPEKLVRADALDDVVQYVALLEAPTAPYLPSWWMARAVTAFVAGRAAEFFRWAGCLAGAAAAVAGGLTLFADRAYYRGWTSAQEAPRRRGRSTLGREWWWTPPLGGTPFRALLGKDALVFFRDPAQWTQGIMLASLAAVYLISVRNLPVDTPFLKNLIAFLNVGTAGFTLASVGLRFVFPSVSLEGKSWWALAASPMGLGRILLAKLWAGFWPLAVLAAVLVGVSNHLLGVQPVLARFSLATIFLMAVTLTAMAVGFGALFPKFQVESVAEIESSSGGLLYMVSSFFYVAVTLALEAVLVKRFYWGRATTWGWEGFWALGALSLLHGAAIFLPLLGGWRSLRNRDI